jgi:hypothetical protein
MDVGKSNVDGACRGFAWLSQWNVSSWDKVWILHADGQAFDRTEQNSMQIVVSTKLFWFEADLGAGKDMITMRKSLRRIYSSTFQTTPPTPRFPRATKAPEIMAMAIHSHDPAGRNTQQIYKNKRMLLQYY